MDPKRQREQNNMCCEVDGLRVILIKSDSNSYERATLESSQAVLRRKDRRSFRAEDAAGDARTKTREDRALRRGPQSLRVVLRVGCSRPVPVSVCMRAKLRVANVQASPGLGWSSTSPPSGP